MTVVMPLWHPHAALNMSFEDVERFSPISEKIKKLKGEDQE